MRRAALIGTGLIGGSVGLALRREGLVVRGLDRDPARADDAKRLGVVDEVARSIDDAVAGADVVVVAVPVGQVAEVVVAALDAGAVLVTDVGSVKAGVVGAVESARPDSATRFVGGHPMAGSEQDGLDGADADLFVGATWVLTPTERTDADAFQAVRSLVRSLGAEVLAVTPEDHDALVAVVSHVPQLAATTLMDVAARHGEEHATLLRLAAGGFRDMTRIAASAPGIWSDICVANGDAIVRALDDYLDALQQVRALLVDADDARLLSLLERARLGAAQPADRDPGGRGARRAAGAGPRPPGRAGRGHDPRRPPRREHRRPRDRALDRGRRRCPRAGRARRQRRARSRRRSPSAATTTPVRALS